MKPCIVRAGLKHGPPCVISLEYNVPGRGARKKASVFAHFRMRITAVHSSIVLQNVTLKHLGQDGESADAITLTIIKAVQQVEEQSCDYVGLRAAS